MRKPGADPENSERGGRKQFWRECNLALYPQHMNILGVIAQQHSKDGYLKKMSKQSQKRAGEGFFGPRNLLMGSMQAETDASNHEASSQRD